MVKAFDDYKGWEDGTYAASCEKYRYPARFYYYEGDDVTIFVIIYLRLEVVFIDCKLLIILLMLTAIWRKTITDIQVLCFYNK